MAKTTFAVQYWTVRGGKDVTDVKLADASTQATISEVNEAAGLSPTQPTVILATGNRVYLEAVIQEFRRIRAISADATGDSAPPDSSASAEQEPPSSGVAPVEVTIAKVKGGFQISRGPCQICGEPPFGDEHCCGCASVSKVSR